MSNLSPAGDLNASTVIGLIESGAYGRDVIATIARGFMPLEQNDLIAVLAYLALYDDAEIAALAKTELAETPSRALLEFAANEELPGDHLSRLMIVATDGHVLEALIRNRAVSDSAVIELARRGDSRVQEVIVINHARILRAPEILDALLENPNLTPDAKRRATETREEFFVKKARLAELAEFQEPDLVDEPLDAIADLLEKAVEFGDVPAVEAPPALTELEKKDDRQSAVWARLQFMSVSEKVQLAFKGDRMIRMLLVRERNKLVCSAVMRNPRMSEQEAEAIAGMRNVEDSVLRLLAAKREWIGKYNIMLTLCRNPKAPVGVVLPFVSRLTLRDLKGLKDDKGVQQVVRELAKKLYVHKTQKT